MKPVSFLPASLLLGASARDRVAPSPLESFTWRSVGPPGAGGRVVWVGSGEANPRNSVSFRDGVVTASEDDVPRIRWPHEEAEP